jgi:hypothetical protein
MSFTIIGYSAAGKAFVVGEFAVTKNLPDEEIILLVQKVIRNSTFSSLLVKSLHYQIDQGLGYVHILDKINLSFIGKK